MPVTFETVVKSFAHGAARSAVLPDDQCDRAAFTLSARYGCEECASTLQGIGDHLGLTRERVRQIIKEVVFRQGRTANNPTFIKRLDA